MYFDFDMREKASAVDIAIARKFNESEESRRSLKSLIKVMLDDDIERSGQVSGRGNEGAVYTREDVSRYLIKKLSGMLDAEAVSVKCSAIEQDLMREKARKNMEEEKKSGTPDNEVKKMPVL